MTEETKIETKIETKQQSKSAFVRGVLAEIGAITKNPPKGWRKKVEEALAKNNMEMNQVSIYQIRLKAIKDSTGVEVKQNKKTTPNVNLTVADLIAIRQFAKQYGGITALKEACATIQTLTQ